MEKPLRKNIKILIVLIVIAIIAGISYWLWVKSIALPIQGELAEFEMDTITGKTYHSEESTIKIMSFIGNDCDESCENMLDQLHNLQEKLIEYGSFGKTVKILSFVDANTSHQSLEQYSDRYKINEDGWHILTGSNEDIQSIKSQLVEQSEGSDGMVYLVDVNHAIRQGYRLTKDDNIAQLLDDITQLIRLHRQYLEEDD